MSFTDLLSGKGFMPHGHCYFWQPDVLWTNVAGDALVALAYFTLPPMLFYFAQKREDLAHKYVFVLFGLFIMACGSTHLIDIWTVWVPVYRLAGLVKVMTGLLSLGTALAVLLSLPQLLALPSREELETANEALQKEVQERQAAERALLHANQELERRVEARTADLTTANVQLQLEIKERQRAQVHLQEQHLQLQRTHADLDSLLYATSHDLRVPVANMEGLQKALWEEISPGSAHLETLLTHLDGNIRQTRQIMRNLADVAFLQQEGRPDVALQPLPEVLAEAQQELRQAHQEAQAVTVSYQEDFLPPVQFSRSLLRMMLRHLLEFSVNFAHPERAPRLEVSATEDENYLCYRFVGNGLEIDLHKLHLSGMFQRLHSEVQDSGIGFYLFRRILEPLHGKVVVESNLHQGTTFSLYFAKATPGKPLSDD